MKKISKVIGVGLVSAVVAGAIIYVAKKIKEVEEFDEDFFDNDDYDEDDDYFEDEDIMSEDDFSDSFPMSDVSDEKLLEAIGLNREACIQSIYDSMEMYSIEELESMSDEVLINLYRSIETVSRATQRSSSDLDPFKLINDATREEVINILLEGNRDNENFEHTKESLSELSDGELTQVYTDYKVSIK